MIVSCGSCTAGIPTPTCSIEANHSDAALPFDRRKETTCVV